MMIKNKSKAAVVEDLNLFFPCRVDTYTAAPSEITAPRGIALQSGKRVTHTHPLSHDCHVHTHAHTHRAGGKTWKRDGISTRRGRIMRTQQFGGAKRLAVLKQSRYMY